MKKCGLNLINYQLMVKSTLGNKQIKSRIEVMKKAGRIGGGCSKLLKILIKGRIFRF